MAPNNLPNRVSCVGALFFDHVLTMSQVGTFGSLITLAISDVIMSVVLAIVFWRRRSVFASYVCPLPCLEWYLMFLRSVNRILRVAILYTMETSLVTAYVFQPLSIPKRELRAG